MIDVITIGLTIGCQKENRKSISRITKTTTVLFKSSKQSLSGSNFRFLSPKEELI